MTINSQSSNPGVATTNGHSWAPLVPITDSNVLATITADRLPSWPDEHDWASRKIIASRLEDFLQTMKPSDALMSSTHIARRRAAAQAFGKYLECLPLNGQVLYVELWKLVQIDNDGWTTDASGREVVYVGEYYDSELLLASQVSSLAQVWQLAELLPPEGSPYSAYDGELYVSFTVLAA